MNNAIFKEPMELMIEGIKYYIQSDNDKLFIIKGNLWCDGTMVIYNEQFLPSAKHNNKIDIEIASFIRSQLKISEASSDFDIQDRTNSICDDLMFYGEKTFPLKMDIRIHKKLKASGVTMVKFINQSILEKLERDGY